MWVHACMHAGMQVSLCVCLSGGGGGSEGGGCMS